MNAGLFRAAFCSAHRCSVTANMQSKCGYQLIKSTDTNAEKFHFTRAANVCKCPYGTAKVDPDCTTDGEHMCKRCDTGYTINGDKTACLADPCTVALLYKYMRLVRYSSFCRRVKTNNVQRPTLMMKDP